MPKKLGSGTNSFPEIEPGPNAAKGTINGSGMRYCFYIYTYGKNNLYH